MPSFFLLTPSTRAPEWAHVASLLYTHKPADGLFYWDVVEGQAIDVARNKCVRKFINCPGKPEFMLMVDSDATWAPEAAIRLMKHNLPVVTGVIFKRGLPPIPTIGNDVGLDAAGSWMYNFGPTIQEILDRTEGIVKMDTQNAVCLDPREGDVIEKDGMGCHFIMIRRDVLEKIPFPWFTGIDNAGEDFDFCRKVKAAGFKLYVDLSVYTGHIVGPRIDYGLREFLAFYKYTNEIRDTEQVWKVKAGMISMI